MISYINGDVTNPQGSGPRIIAHVCNDKGGFGKGVALAVANKWPDAKAYFKKWYASGEGFSLGETQFVEVEDSLWIANMVAQHGYRTTSNPVPIRYAALESCLTELDYEATVKAASIHMPRIGCGLAGSSWGLIEPLIQKHLGYKDVYVYDLT